MPLLPALLGAALAQDVTPTQDVTPATPEPAKERGMRIYLSGGQAAIPGQGVRGTAAIGAGTMTRGAKVSGAFGGELAAVDTGSGFYLPVINLDAAVRWSPFPQAPLRPYASAGVGATVVLILPFPDLTLGLGLELPLGSELLFDAELHARQILPLWPNSEPVTLTSLRLGLGF
ncbi:MAG: hypothetical protein H6741_11005 [Alphaproteobacteria bacterium]|nr:hypothetical protein [Alphaproteobacteria bacterium]